MAGPFYNNIKGTTAGTPGTGAFTPNAASTGYLAWSTVPTGWIGMVRFEDGSAWELQYSYWNGTTLSRAATTQFVSSSSGSALTLTSAATAEMVMDANVVQPLLMVPRKEWIPITGNSTYTSVGIQAPTANGTAAGINPANTSLLDLQPRVRYTSATTANAIGGVKAGTGVFAFVSTTAGSGGFECRMRWGVSTLPSGPRLVVGVSDTAAYNVASEPSAVASTNAIAFSKDSTDTNIQLLTRRTASTNKIDTGIPLVAGGFYESSVWCLPGSTTVYAYLARLDTGAIYYASTSNASVPATGTTMDPICITGLGSGSTAGVMDFAGMYMRVGGI